MDRLLQDLRFAFRSLRRQPGFAAIVIVTLALGIGVNLSVFQAAYGLLLRPLPFVDAEGLVALGMRHETLEVEAFDFSQQDVRDFREQCVVCESVAAFDSRDVVLGSAVAESAWRVQGQAVSPELFGLLGVHAAIGRTLTVGNHDAQLPEVVISHGLWQQLGGDLEILGQDLKVDGRPAQIVGIMPPEFRFPERSDLWLPLEQRPDARRSDRWIDNVMLRLKPDASLQQAQQEADVLAAAMAAAHPESNRFWSFSLMPFRDRLVSGDEKMVLAMLGLCVAFVWLIACVNVTNLLFARESSRVRSVAIRIALGSDRASLIRQRMTENLLLAFVGGGLGLLLAMWSLDLLARSSPEGWPSWLRFGLTSEGVLFSLGLTVASAFVFGLLPSLRASRPRQGGPLVDSERGASDGEAQGLQSNLVVAQIALALVLLVSAGLVAKSVQALWRIDAGFDTANVLTLRTLPTGERYDDPAARLALYDRVVSRLKNLPGVAAAAATSVLPLVEDGTAIPYFHSDLNLASDERQVASYILQTPELFDVLQVPVLAGRRFTAAEAAAADSRVIMINDQLAQRVWPAGNAVGQALRLGYEADAPEYTVVGVVPKIYYEEPGEETEQSRFQIHLPYAWTPWRSMAIMLRTHTDPSAVVADVRRELAAIDATMAIDSVRSLDSIRGEVIWSERLQGNVFGMFAVMALLLSVVGIYGVMSYLVARRTREIGVRMALGANRKVISHLFMRRGSWMIGKGVALGLLGSLAVARLLSHAFFGIGGAEPGPIVIALIVLIAAAGVGIALPASRATRVEPTVALESE